MRAPMMKIATWNVNGIRARQAQVQEFIEREQPDVLCLQEIKAGTRSAACLAVRPRRLLVLLARRQRLLGRRPARAARPSHPSARSFIIPSSTTSTGSSPRSLPQATVASIYVPNGGKDFPAKMRFLEALDALRRRSFERIGQPLVLCGDLNVARTEMDVHPKERQAARHRPAAGRARAASSGSSAAASSTSHRALDPDNAELFTWWAPWRNMKQRNIGWRLDYVLASDRSPIERRVVRRCSVRWARATTDPWSPCVY